MRCRTKGDAEKRQCHSDDVGREENTKRNREIVWRRDGAKKTAVSHFDVSEEDTKRYREVSEREVLPRKSSVTLDDARRRWC